MAERLLGVETEYAFVSLDSRGRRVDSSARLEALMRLARSQLTSLPDHFSNGVYLGNGSRLYIDVGEHPELSTPECDNPWDAVRYLMAGERILVGLASELKREDRGKSTATFFKHNVDYGGTGSSWGSHESYLHRADPEMLPEQIIPHLVSRLVYTGAGGFDTTSPGLQFTLSPRVPHLVHTVSGSSTSARGIFHTKDEPLCCNGFHRLHILCGESLCSNKAMWLRLGTTALVVALIEAGIRPGDGVQIRGPLSAMRSFSQDVTCTVTAELCNGQHATAVDIQRHYLELAEAHLRDSFMPAWAPDVCRAWRRMLDRLENAPQTITTTLDWGIKLALYKQHAGNGGVDWESLRYWTEVMTTLCAALSRAKFKGRTVSAAVVLGPASPVAEEVKRLTPFVRRSGLSWDDLKVITRLRKELFEIDMRFGQLGEGGIFSTLDRAGVLDHQVLGLDEIEHAIGNPPAVGRARIRGELIRQLAQGDRRYSCDWQSVWDHSQRRVIRLNEPFATTAEWQDWRPDEQLDLLAHPAQRQRLFRAARRVAHPFE